MPEIRAVGNGACPPWGLKDPALVDNRAGSRGNNKQQARSDSSYQPRVPNPLSLAPLGTWGQSHPSGEGDPTGMWGFIRIGLSVRRAWRPPICATQILICKGDGPSPHPQGPVRVRGCVQSQAPWSV